MLRCLRLPYFERRLLVGVVVQVGRDEKMDRITGEILLENSGMLRTSRKAGFKTTGAIQDGVVRVGIDL